MFSHPFFNNRQTMFSIVLYIFLPLILLFHLAEELIIRLRSKAPGFGKFCAVAAACLLGTAVAAVCLIYADAPVPAVIMTWAFCIHILWHLAAGVKARSYRPGLVTAIVLLPYAGFAVADMLRQFSPLQNLLYALAGILVVLLCTFLTRR